MLDMGCIQMLIRFRNQNGSRPSQWIHGERTWGEIWEGFAGVEAVGTDFLDY